MAIKVRIMVRQNAVAKEKVASANIVDLRNMPFEEFCDYLAQDSTVGAADVAAVMTQVEKKLPMLLGMGCKVAISQGGMTVKPTVSGSLTQSQLKAKLEAKKAAGNTDIDTGRVITTADLTTNDLTAGVAIDFGKKFRSSFGNTATFTRVNSGTEETTTTDDVDDAPVTEEEGDDDEIPELTH